jgi:hypothetical protein
MNLKTWNWIAAGVHGASAIGLGIYFLVKKGNVNFNTDLYTYDVDLNADDPDNSVVTAKKAVSISDVLMKILVIVYFAFTTFFHILYATDYFVTGDYTRAVANQNNYFRWNIEFFSFIFVCIIKNLLRDNIHVFNFEDFSFFFKVVETLSYYISPVVILHTWRIVNN